MGKIEELIDFKITLDKQLQEIMQSTAIALQNKTILHHKLSGNTGELVEVRRHSLNGKIYIIQLKDGRQYFAPAGEFVEMKI